MDIFRTGTFEKNDGKYFGDLECILVKKLEYF